MSPDENIEYSDRISNQIKIRGFRIEPNLNQYVNKTIDLVNRTICCLPEQIVCNRILSGIQQFSVNHTMNLCNFSNIP